MLRAIYLVYNYNTDLMICNNAKGYKVDRCDMLSRENNAVLYFNETKPYCLTILEIRECGSEPINIMAYV